MEAERTQVHLVQAAQIELGLPPRYSLDDVTDFGAAVDIQFPRCIARCFGLHDWPFCRLTDKPARLSETPVNGFRYGFQLRGDRLGPPLKTSSDPRCRQPVRDILIEGDVLYCNEALIYTRCKVKRDPRDWDDQFADIFSVALASMLAIPVKQDADLAEMLHERAFGPRRQGLTGGLFGRLIAQHVAGEPIGENLYENDPLTSAHGGAHGGAYGGGWSGSY